MKTRRLFLYAAGLVSLSRPARAAGHNRYCAMRDTGGGVVAQRQIVVFGSGYSSHRLEAARSGRAQTVLLEQPASYRPVLRDIRSGFYPPGTVAVFDRSNDPDRVLLSLDRPVERVHLLFNVPESMGEAVHVHGRRSFPGGVFQRGASEPELAYNLQRTFVPVAAALRSMGGTKILPGSDGNAAESLDRYVQRLNQSDVVLIVSHVVRTRQRRENPNTQMMDSYETGLLPLSDGSTWQISKGRQNSPVVWTIGCDTWSLFDAIPNLDAAELALTEAITYEDAVNIVRVLYQMEAIRAGLHGLQKQEWRPRAIQPSGQAVPSELPLQPREQRHLDPPRPNEVFGVVAEIVLDNNIIINQKVVV